MRVLLCLLSQQHVPNLLAIHHYLPDCLVLVESNDSRKKQLATHLLDAIRLGGLDYTNHPGEDRSHIEPLESEDDLNAVRTSLRHAFNRYPGAEWLVNVTGGNKPMSIATYDFFNGLIRRDVLNGRILYTNVAHPGTIIDLDSHVSENVDHRVSIKQFLAGYGFESRKADAKIAEGESRARRWWDCSRAIAAEAGASSLLSLSDDERERARDKGLELAPGRLRSGGKPFWPSVAEALSLQVEDGCLMGRLDKYAVQFLTGGWLEVFLWGLLDCHAETLGIWDVRLGLDVGQKGASTGNDFDVAFMLKHGLCMIECKSGSQSHDPATDILYKIEAVMQQFRALRVRSWLATTSPTILDRTTGEIKASIQTRAEIHNCGIILTEDIRRLAAAPDDGELVKNILFFNHGHA
jgi:hypothetical protein